MLDSNASMEERAYWARQGAVRNSLVKFWKIVCLLLFLLSIPSFKLLSQEIYSIDENIRLYQFHISTAMQHSFSNRNELANKEILIANTFKPIHQWHAKELRYLLKKKFDNDIFFILVRLEFIKGGNSYSYSDTSLSHQMSNLTKKKIESNKGKWQLEYLNSRDEALEKKLLQIESIDQFTRTINMGAVLPCGDSCFNLKRKLFRYSDSAYSRKYFNEIIKETNLNIADFGSAYFDFLLIARHLLGKWMEADSDVDILYLEFCRNALLNFFITPDYYANLMDYCFNFKFDAEGNRIPTNSFGEFLNYKGKIYIDNPETIDWYRAKLGLLPIYQTIRDSTKLPANYLNWKNQK
jgi:hypothetical protein